ncbi:unnamed protein product, partial [marine sediment metagenome]
TLWKWLIDKILPPENVVQKNDTELYRKLVNGTEIYGIGLDSTYDVNKLASREYGFIAVEEAVEITEEDYDKKIIRCLRLPGVPFHQLVLATNPGAPSHFLYKRFYMQKKDDDYKIIEGTILPDLPESYYKRVNSLTGIYRERYKKGKWVSFEGLVYPFNPVKHIIEPFKIPPDGKNMTEEIKKKKQAEAFVTLTKGRQFIQTSKGIYPLSVLKKHEIKKTSKQIKEEEQFGINELKAPPNSPTSLLQLYDMNSTFSACVDQIAEDVAGLGWRLELKEGGEEDEDEKKKITELLDRPNPDEYLRHILKEMLIDVGIIGWGGFEIVRNAIGEVAEIWHIAGHTFRIHKKKKKFCQERNNKKVWFKRYGEEKDISAKDGKQGKF